MSDNLLYQISLTLIPHIGDVQAKALISHFGDAEAVLKARLSDLERLDGIGPIRAKSIKSFNNFTRAEEEIAFLKKYKITPLFITDDKYPKRFLNCYDSPAILYYKGNADLNTSKIVGIVGTRSSTDYGKNVCEKLVDELNDENILIVSGLAFGIDSIAHKAALKNNMKTVGVVGHGLDQIYPSQNKALAKQMVEQGGILTEFRNGTPPDKVNFPRRNRIVAGICDAIVIIETGIKGGSLITAEVANSYNKDVFAIPGRVNDSKSEGCNYLIKSNKAALITNAADISESMGWAEQKKKPAKKQRALFVELTNEEKVVADILSQEEQIHIDNLYLKSNLSSSAVASALLTLEMQGLVSSLPGKMYRMV